MELPILDWAYVGQFLSIVWLDVVLSGDNALVIGIAASTLPRPSSAVR